MTDHHDLEDRLTRLLHALGDAASQHGPTGGAGAAAARTRARARRDRRRVSAGVATVVVLAAGITYVGTRPDGPHRVVVPGAGVGAAAAPVIETAPKLDWTLVDSLDVRRLEGVAVRSGALRYAVGTGAAEGGTERTTLYSSSDGRRWQPHPMDGYTISKVAAAGDDLYVVGTAASTRPPISATRHHPGTAVVRRSSDGGTSWHDITLPVDLEGLSDGGAQASASLDIATMGDTVIVEAVVEPYLDSPAMRLAAPSGYSIVGDGIDILGQPTDAAAAAATACPAGWTAGASIVDVSGETTVPGASMARKYGGAALSCPSPQPGVAPLLVPLEPTVTGHRTWAQLGIDPRLVTPQRHLFVSAKGAAFAEVADPFPAADRSVQAVRLLASNDVALALVTRSDREDVRVEVYRSSDGRTWTLAPNALPGAGWISSAAVVDGQFVVADQGKGTGSVRRSSDGRSWTSTSFADVIAAQRGPGSVSVQSVQVDGSGIAALVDVTPDDGGFRYGPGRDGYRLRDREGHLEVVVEATGESVGRVELGRAGINGRIRVDLGGNHQPSVSVIDPVTGRTLSTLTVNEPERRPGTALVVWSPDGRRWGSAPVAELTGVATLAAQGTLGLSDGQIVVPLADTRDGADGSSRSGDTDPNAVSQRSRRSLVAGLHG